MNREDRARWIRQHGFGLGYVILAYLLVTVLRSLRADFATELWAALGTTVQPGVFTRSERGNLGYLMYLADAVGYLGYVAVMIGRNWLGPGVDFLDFFRTTAWVAIAVAAMGLWGAWWQFARRRDNHGRAA